MVGGCGLSLAVYRCTHGAQLNFDDMYNRAYLIYKSVTSPDSRYVTVITKLSLFQCVIMVVEDDIFMWT